MFQVLRTGDLEELNLEETTDLRDAKVERFLIFNSASSYRFDIDGKRLEWGHKVISGRVLKRLAGVDPARFGVWLEVMGNGRKWTGPHESAHAPAIIDFCQAGLEPRTASSGEDSHKTL